MTLIEYNKLDLTDKFNYLFGDGAKNSVNFNCFLDINEYYYSLWDCGTFFSEMKKSRALNKVVSIEAIGLEDERINIYLDWIKEHEDDLKYK